MLPACESARSQLPGGLLQKEMGLLHFRSHCFPSICCSLLLCSQRGHQQGRTPCCPARMGTVMSVQTSGCIIKTYLHPKACTALNELISLKSAVGQANSNLPLSDLEGEGRRCREICRRKTRKPFYPNYSTNQQSSATTFPTPSTKPLNHCK